MEDAERNKTRRGIMRALEHAIDMNRDGKLSEKELDSFRRHLTAEAIDTLSMDEHVEFHKNGTLNKLMTAAAQHPEDEPADYHGLKRSRSQLAAKIVSDFIEKAHDAGSIDDETYDAEMRKLGVELDDGPLPSSESYLADRQKANEPIDLDELARMQRAEG